jgi:DNA polymerase-3 subunit delta
MNFNVFKTRVLPAMQAFDQELQQVREKWYPDATGDPGPKPAAKKSRKGKAKATAGAGSKTDLKTVPNPKNPYPIYQLLKKSDRFTTTHLRSTLRELARADMQIKTGGGDLRIILERVVLSICEGGREGESSKLKAQSK